MVERSHLRTPPANLPLITTHTEPVITAADHKKRRKKTITGVLFTLGGITGIAVALFTSIESLRLILNGVRTTGTVIEMRQSRGVSTRRDTTRTVSYAPTFTFRDQAGMEHTIAVTLFSAPPEHRVGDRVPVLYHPANPKEARINQYPYQWWMPTLATFIGLIYLLIGLTRILRRNQDTAA